MKKKPKIDWTYYVHWLIFWCVVMGVVGLLLQLIRFGTLVESGDIGPTGF